MAKCTHYYILESTHEPKVKGVCQYCGHEKIFPNILPPFKWGTYPHATKRDLDDIFIESMVKDL